MNSAPSFSLWLFGSPWIERVDGTLVSGRAAQRHRLGLLALLALAPGGRAARDKLMAYLWPEADAERARNLLNVSVYVLRRALGDAAVLSSGDDLRLNPAVIGVDVAQFEAALAAGDRAAAARLYAGPFLDGFFLSDAPEFERWVERERKRLAGAHEAALEALAEAAEAEHDIPAAVQWWKARATQDPYSGRVAVRLMRALDAAGDRAGALQHARQHAALLREEFDAGPDPEVTGFAERLRLESPARTAPERLAGETGRAAPPPQPVATAGGIRGMSAGGARPTRRSRTTAAALLFGLAIVGAYGIREMRSAPSTRSIAVLPFVNLGGDEEEYFSDGLTEELITALSRVREIRVVARTSAFAFKGENRDIREIGRVLNVVTVVEGSVRRDGERVRVTAQLINAADGFHLWSETYDRRLTDIFEIQRDVAVRIAEALEAELSPGDRERLARRATEDPEAHILYLKGRHFWGQRTGPALLTAIDYFERAIAADPGYAQAHAGLATAYASLGVHAYVRAEEARERMRHAALRATEIDPNLAEARTALAAYRQLFEWDWASAEREFRRAIALDPDFPTAHLWYGYMLESLGRYEEAAAEIGRSVELEPLAAGGYSALGFAQFLAGHTARALEHIDHALQLDSTGWMTHSQHGQIREAMGEWDAAIASYERAVTYSGGATKPMGSLARAWALAGREDEARRMLAPLVSEAERTGWHTPLVATVLLALGDVSGAIDWLEQAYVERQPDLLHIPADPRFAALRDEPRFLALLDRIGLPRPRVWGPGPRA